MALNALPSRRSDRAAVNDPGNSMLGPLESIFSNLEKHCVNYCVLRDGDRLNEISNGGEIDLLIEESNLTAFKRVVQNCGFMALPSSGHWPHHFFVAYLRETDGWLKLDVITKIVYGRPSHVFETDLGKACLARRQMAHQIFVPAPDDELMALLLHCILDKNAFPDKHRLRLRTLRQLVHDTNALSKASACYLSPDVDWKKIDEMIEADQWADLVNLKQTAVLHLKSKSPLKISYRDFRDRALRKWNRLTMGVRLPGLLIAVLAPDGAGKSTLVQSIENSFFFSTKRIYMGLYPKKSKLRKKASLIRQIPGWGFGTLLLTQWSRYFQGCYHRVRGRLVLFDRYTYDALLPTPERRGTLSRLRRRLLGNACPGPDLVVMLNAPGSVLHARKQEHTPEKLEKQRQSYLAMQSFLPQMVVVDATDDEQSVCRNVKSIIWQHYLGRRTQLGRRTHLNRRVSNLES